LFGSENALGKVFRLETDRELKVAAIVEDVPSNSTLQFDFLLSVPFLEATQPWFKRATTDWQNHVFTMFVELRPGSDPNEVSAEIASLEKNNNPAAPTAAHFLHALDRWHLYNEFENGKASGGMMEYVTLFTVVAIFILVIACINFTNLATARSQSRAREVGIRKSIGSQRKQLIAQFIGESLLTTTAAFLLALVIVEISLPFYNLLVEKSLFIDFSNPMIWLCAIAIVLLTGLLAGSYPAFYLSSFQPVKVLKGTARGGSSSVTPRKILVTLQFAFSISLIIGTIVIFQQIMHVKARHVGYDRENLLLIWTNEEREKNFQTIKEQLMASGVAESVTKSSAPITRIFSSTDGVSWAGKVGDDKVSFTTIATEYDFTKTLGIKMLHGRDFSPEFRSDTSAIIINESALKLMGLEDPLGHKMKIWGDERTIIGVSENVVMGSPYHPVGPLAMVLIPDWSSTITVRLKPTQDVESTVSRVEKIFKDVDPEHPLWHRFADAEFQTKFKSINLVGRLAWGFALLAIFISCLGLFGLAAFTAEQRTKEVGIRKVLGASVTNIVVLISKDFSLLITIAFLIAAPITWWMIDIFLEQYPYRITPQWWVLVTTGVSMLLLTVVIVSTQALRAALSNPVSSLRSE
jgi:hypothetical protein